MELFKVDFGLTIWMFVAFAILLFILWKFAWPAILKGVDSRADIIADANKMKTQIIEEAREEAKKEAQKVLDSAKLSIEQSRKEAEKSLRDEVSRYALAIAGQVTREQLKDAEAQKRLVNSLLDDIEKKN